MNNILLMVFVIITILMLLIPFKKSILNTLNKNRGLKNITIYGYILIGLALLNITGLTWNYIKTNKPDPTYFLKKSFDDTLYSLSKQLNSYNFSYDKSANKINPLNIKTSNLEEISNWDAGVGGKNSFAITGWLSLLNRCNNPIINIKGKITFLHYAEDQIVNNLNPVNLFSPLNLIQGQSITPGIQFICTISDENIFYTKVDYEDDEGFPGVPIRHIYSIRNVSGEAIQPKIISNYDSLNIIKSYLIKNNIW